MALPDGEVREGVYLPPWKLVYGSAVWVVEDLLRHSEEVGRKRAVKREAAIEIGQPYESLHSGVRCRVTAIDRDNLRVVLVADEDSEDVRSVGLKAATSRAIPGYRRVDEADSRT